VDATRRTVSFQTDVPADKVPLLGAIIDVDGQPMRVADIFRGAIPSNRHLALHALNITPEQAQRFGPWTAAEARGKLAPI
jgi:hypothetical protein